MGLDFSHGNAHWSYSGFNTFRKKICKTLGVISEIDQEIYDDNTYLKLENDAIFPLINHSDCDGILTVYEMKTVLPRLQTILDEWRMSDDKYYGDIERGERLIESMSEAVKKGEDLEFT